MNKETRAKYQRKYRKQDPERYRATEARYKEQNAAAVKQRNRDWRLKKFFNITDEDFQRIRQFQANHPSLSLLIGKGNRNESVEHRHSDGLIRGVMSGLLNRAYGVIERLYPTNTSDVLRALADFHDNPPASIALGEPVYGVIGRAKPKKSIRYGPDGSPSPRQRIPA